MRNRLIYILAIIAMVCSYKIHKLVSEGYAGEYKVIISITSILTPLLLVVILDLLIQNYRKDKKISEINDPNKEKK